MAPPITQLWATAADARRIGVPPPALVSRTPQEIEYALRAASGILASHIRGPYELPLLVVQELAEESGLAGGAVAFELEQASPREAVSAWARVAAGGDVGTPGVTVERSYDGGWTWESAEALALDGRVLWPSPGLAMVFSGVLAVGDAARYAAGVDWGIRQYVVDLAMHSLIVNRGVDPASHEGQAISKRYETAIAWGREVQTRAAKLAEGGDATPNQIDPRPRGGRRSGSPYVRWRDVCSRWRYR